jgi:hypothetical protein
VPNISYTFWMGVLISILNPVPNISYTLLVGVLISIPNSVPESSAQYFMHILSGHPYLHPELSAWFQCPIFHIHSEWVFISPYWIQCPNLESDILSGHSYLHTESSARIQCLILHIFLVGILTSIPNWVPNCIYSWWAFISPYWIQCLNPVPNISYILWIDIKKWIQNIYKWNLYAKGCFGSLHGVHL